MNGELAGVTGPGTAFVAGLVTSLHCAGMCGPLACAILPGARADTDPNLVACSYHASRLASYALLGALAGATGRWPLELLGERWLRWLPWLGVILFVALALRIDRHLPRLGVLGQIHGCVLTRLRGGSRVRAAGLLGLATPLLPCGPLYVLLSLALFAGSAARGAETLLAFGLGTVPLLWLAQANFSWIQARLGPCWLGRLQTALALAAALVLVWRLRGMLGLGGTGAGNLVCF